MNGSHEAIYGLVRKIVENSMVAREVQLPSLSLLRGRAWSEPLVFLYEGDSWPGVIYPYHLLEVSRSFFSVVPTSAQQCPHFTSEESSQGLTVPGVTYVVQMLRFEVVGTVFSIELYKLFARSDAQTSSSVRSTTNQPIGSAVVRVITNEAGLPMDAKTTASHLAQLSEEQLQHMFFHTFTPLVGITLEQLEKKWYSCVAASFSQSDGESGVISSSRHSSQCCNDEACPLSSSCPVEFLHSAVFSNQNSVSDGCCVKTNNSMINTCTASHATRQGVSASTDLSLRMSTLLCMFDQEEQCRNDVVVSWARWTNGWNAVSRSSVVDSIDDIITSLGGSRGAAHAAVAYLDTFICVSEKVVKDPTYFSGILLACAMLGCKEVDRFFPSIKSFLRCLRSDSRITEAEFLLYEMHVFETLDFRLHQFTTLEAVESLLHICSSPVALQIAEREHRARELKRWNGDANGSRRSTNSSGINLCGFMNCDGDDLAFVDISRWKDLCKLARFFTDVMCRHTRAQEFRRTTLGVAILAVAAEKTCWSLPAPLMDILPESHQVAVTGGTKMELDSDNYELLVRYAATMRRRCEEEESADVTTKSLGRAVKFVRECCGEFIEGRHKVEGVLQRRYNISHTRE